MKKPTPRKAAAKAAPAMPMPDRKYMVEDAVRTLVRAHEIRNDAGLMKEVQAHAAKHKDALSKIARGSKV